VAAVARRDETRPDSGILEVYLNGRRVGVAEFDGNILPVGNEPLGIGDSASISSAGTRFRGYLDELALWKKALSAHEIRAHFAARKEILDALERPLREAEIAQRARVAERLKPFGVGQIVFAQRGMGRDMAGHYYANFGYYCTDPTRWFHAGDGGSLGLLDVRTGDVTMLVDDPGGSVRDPQVHFDAQKILFSYRRGGTHHYHLYEINRDGSGLRQITDGPWDDVEPAYLPDGDIVFSSSRCKRYIGCWLAPSATLHRCNADGQNIRLLSSGGFTENTPAVLHDGRVLYTRWEYVNRDPVSFHHLWTMNPDGSGSMVYFGNMHPGSVLIDAKPIPGSPRIVLIDSPGHGRNEHVGFVATATDQHGPDARTGLTRISREAEYRDPYPLSGDTLLVARGSQLLLMDGGGTTEVLYTAAGSELHEPSPLIARPRPAALSPRVDLTQSTGTVVLADVYAGRHMAGVQRGAVKRLLVLEDLPKPANYHGGGSQPIGHGVTSTLKRILGTVPVESDGSAHFEVPALRSIYFALLDERDRSIKQMRSFVTVQPGETVGCVGCHDSRHETPATSRMTLALERPPSPIQPIADVPAIPDFPRDIQPILDRHCARCHNPDKLDGGVMLANDRGPVYSLSYYELYLYWQIKDTSGPPAHGTGRQLGNDPPYQTYSSASPLMQKIDGSHYDVRLADDEARMVRLWIDAGAQFAGTYAAIGTGQVGGCWNLNEPVRVMADDWPSTAAAKDAVERRCAACHGRMLPRHVTDQLPISYGDMLSWERPLTRYSRHRVFNLTRPDKSLLLLTPLARQAGGYAEGEPVVPAAGAQPLAEDRSRPPRPVVHPVIFRDTHDPDYRGLLAHVEAARAKLDEIKRFDMPGFKPNGHYVREMQRFGVLPAAFDLATDPIDVYATDQAYWQSMWHRPRAN
jgi:mono/diheme cytochrome c family protein